MAERDAYEEYEAAVYEVALWTRLFRVNLIILALVSLVAFLVGFTNPRLISWDNAMLFFREAFLWPAWYFNAWFASIEMRSWEDLAVLAWMGAFAALVGREVLKFIWCMRSFVEIGFIPVYFAGSAMLITLPFLFIIIVVMGGKWEISPHLARAALMAWVGIPFWALMLSLAARATYEGRDMWKCRVQDSEDFEVVLRRYYGRLSNATALTAVMLALAAVIVWRYVDTLILKIPLLYLFAASAAVAFYDWLVLRFTSTR